jgi:chromosome segregation ATPase
VNRGTATVIRDALGTARAQLDDLQAELEAGNRQAQKLLNCAFALDGAAAEHRTTAEQLSRLRERAADLQESLREQRALMNQLRDSLNDLRRHFSRRT